MRAQHVLSTCETKFLAILPTRRVHFHHLRHCFGSCLASIARMSFSRALFSSCRLVLALTCDSMSFATG